MGTRDTVSLQIMQMIIRGMIASNNSPNPTSKLLANLPHINTRIRSRFYLKPKRGEEVSISNSILGSKEDLIKIKMFE